MKSIALTLSLAVGWLAAAAALAAEPCQAPVPAACAEVQTRGGVSHCACCGRACQCEKYCRVVCGEKEVKKTVWVVKCEDFCAPLPNCGHSCCKGGQACCNSAEKENCAGETACCNGCGKKCDPCAVERNKCYIPPKCGKVRTKKTLEKKEVVCKVPAYKCLVVYCCPDCCGQGYDGQAAPAPAKPTVPPTLPPAPVPGKTTERAPLPPATQASLTE
jgi:hypothetical protein